MKNFKTTLLLGLMVGISIIVGAKIIASPEATITVTGEAKLEEMPQVAKFSASVEAFNQDKQTATSEVNEKMGKITKVVKDFGISDKDIQTQNVSVYEVNDGPEILIFPPRPQRESGWQASNSIRITLREINQASALADLLQQSEATSVNGPNFSLDDTADFEAELLTKAVEDAREKGEKTAQAAKRKLGKVVTVTESGTAPIYRGLEMVVSSDSLPVPIEPGSETVYKTVTVVFELR